MADWRTWAEREKADSGPTSAADGDLLEKIARGPTASAIIGRPGLAAPGGSTPWREPGVEVGSDHLSDLVLEVDCSTDVRRGKLGLYEAWGFPRCGSRCWRAARPGAGRG